MGLSCGSFALALAAFGLWPVLRSSSYILTNRRLIVTSRFGKTIDIPLSQIARGKIAVDPLTSSLTLRGKRTTTLRYIGGCRQLWSLLLLPAPDEASDAEILPDAVAATPFATAPSESSGPDYQAIAAARDAAEQESKQSDLQRGSSDSVEFVYWHAQRIDGLKTQKGVAVLRPAYFVFLPATGTHNLAAMTAGAAAGVAAEALDIHTIHIKESKVPFDALLLHLAQCSAATFDAEMCRLVGEFNALVWKHGDAAVERTTKKIPLQGRYFVHVHNRTTGVTGSLRRDQLPAFHRLAAQWPEVPDLEYRSVASVVFMTVLLVFLSAFTGGAIYFAFVEPNVLGTIATVFITALTLAGWVAWFRTLLPKRRSTHDKTSDHDLRRINAPRFER